VIGSDPRSDCEELKKLIGSDRLDMKMQDFLSRRRECSLLLDTVDQNQSGFTF